LSSRLSRGGNRQINHVLHIMATVQLRNPTEGRAYFDRKKAAGKTSMEAMRALKRRLSDIVYRQLLADALTPSATGPREPWSDLFEDHAVVVSHHDATHTRAKIKHHVYGRNCGPRCQDVGARAVCAHRSPSSRLLRRVGIRRREPPRRDARPTGARQPTILRRTEGAAFVAISDERRGR
jgi:hypothetical protein